MNADKQMLYFGYGSNMCTGRLRTRVPSAKPLSKCFLRNYRFSFNKVSNDGSGKGNITQMKTPEAAVWGILFDIDPKQKPDLDRAEGLGHGYNEMEEEIELEDGQKYKAVMYIAGAGHTNDMLQPYSWYKRFVMEGAAQHSLPPSYIKFLDSFADNADPNKPRDAANRAIKC